MGGLLNQVAVGLLLLFLLEDYFHLVCLLYGASLSDKIRGHELFSRVKLPLVLISSKKRERGFVVIWRTCVEVQTPGSK